MPTAWNKGLWWGSSKVICKVCSKEFIAKNCEIKRGASYCSRSCFFTSVRKSKKVNCHNCKKEIIVLNYKFKKYKHQYCSKNCQGTIVGNRKGKLSNGYHGGKLKNTCLFCQKVYEIWPYEKDQSKFCSRICQGHYSARNIYLFKPTSIEVAVYEELENRNILFEKQKNIEGKFVVDAYIPELNLIIEADGDYWHSLEKAKIRDEKKNKYLLENGYSLIRLKESEIKSGKFRKILPF